MITIIKSGIDFYKEKYEQLEKKCKFQELLIEKYENKIDSLKEENNAYKILLKNKLEE